MADWYFRNNQAGGLKKCPSCGQLVRSDEEFCPYCAKRLRAERSVFGLVRRFMAQPDIASRVLLGIMVVGFLAQMAADLLLPEQYKGSGGGGGFLNLLMASPLTYIRLGSNFQFLVAADAQYWRFLTSCFLHFGLMHIFFNGYAFWDLGRLAERMWGGVQVFAAFILTGVCGSFASYFWNAVVNGAPVNSAGASGAICGVLGLFLGAYSRNRGLLGDQLGSHLIRWAVYILVFGLVMGADNAAHIGGMLSGAVFGYLLPPTRYSRTASRDMKIWRAAAWVSLAVLLAGIGFAVFFYARGPQYAVLLANAAIRVLGG
jgi:rhomboid protease GluP